MNLPRLVRTSSFRLTLLYAGSTILIFALLFAVIFWTTTALMQDQIDTTVTNEIDEIRDAARDTDIDSLRHTVADSVAHSPGFFYALQDRGGNLLAGNLPGLEPVTGIREWRDDGQSPGHPHGGIRGRGVIVAGGAYLFVGASALALHEMRESVAHSFLWGGAAALLLALLAGAAMSVSVLRRIEGVSQTGRDIVDGNLRQRIALNGSGDEFDHLAVSLNAMLDRIQQLMEGLRQVSTDIAHDLRTPLTRLRQRLEFVRERDMDAAMLQTTFATMLTDIDSILQTFNALLRIAQIESGTRRSSFVRVDLSELLHTVAEIYQSTIEENSQSLGTHIEADLRVLGDRDLLTQLFANLMENATRHCTPGAHVSLRAARCESGIEVNVSDDGPGIPESMRGKVLERFVRLDVSRTTPGNGLGLSLVAATAALHGAQLRLHDNHPGLRITVIFETKAEAT
ncbi:MAG: ATP-binding protein [Rudaea sp.]|nr:ATP-binding protein [Rudaea sp.]